MYIYIYICDPPCQNEMLLAEAYNDIRAKTKWLSTGNRSQIVWSNSLNVMTNV